MDDQGGVMRIIVLVGGLCLTPSLVGCTSSLSLLPVSPTVNTPTVVADGAELHDKARAGENMRARRKPRTARTEEVPRNAIAAEDYRPSPEVGTPEWELARKQDEEKERRLNTTIRSICRGC
jgi:hypothetical protein